MQQKAALQELLQYIRILILDDEKTVGYATKIRLQQSGYPEVDYTADISEAWDKLSQTNIILVDHFLGDAPQTGIEFTREAKKEYGNNLDVLIYSGSVEKLVKNALEAGATACLEKPLRFEYLELWIQETARRIWLEKILNAIPDEVMVIDPNDSFFGKIHYVNETKKRQFEKSKALEYDYCWKRFEKQGEGNQPCRDCLSREAKNDEKTVRAYWNYTTWDGKKESVDIHAAPIRDQIGNIRGIIETCRDRTGREVMQQNLRKIETENNWDKRMELFLKGFIDLGYHRVRFYQKQIQNNQLVYQGVRQIGMPNEFDIHQYCYLAKKDKPTEIILKDKYPTLFVVKKDEGFNWIPLSTNKHVYRVDNRLVPDNMEFMKKKWVDIPVVANREVIAKVSVEPKDQDAFISNYELELLAYYTEWAGQALANAESREKLRLNDETNKLIIKMNRKISKIPVHRHWVYRAVRQVCEVLDTSSCTIFLLKRVNESARLVRKSSYARDKSGKRIRAMLKEEYEPGQYFVGNVFTFGRSRICNNLAKIAEKQRAGGKQVVQLESYDYYSDNIKEPLRNIMCVVLRREGKKIGIIRTLNKRRADIFGNRDFTKDDLKAFEALAGQIAIAYEAADLLEQLNKSKELQEFITQEYSHTLKNLMQPVITISGLLKTDPNDQELWDLLSNEISKMKTTINTMLELAKLESQTLKLRKSLINIPEMIYNVIKPYKILAADRDMDIKVVIDANIQCAELDFSLIYDAIANLLDNAIKYGKEKEPIEIAATIVKKKIQISVSDIGETIPLDIREKIFEKFFTGENVVDKVHQLGLGLTYVKVVTEAHGGKVYVDPDFTQGTKLVMRLPIDSQLENEGNEKNSDH